MIKESQISVNPFVVLHLDPSANEEEIVRQAGRMRRRAADDATRNAVLHAAQALMANADDQRLFALLTHAAPCHQWPALERFIAAFRRHRS